MFNFLENYKKPKEEIKDIVLAITYKCNGRCQFCHIWKTSDSFSATLQDYKRLPHNLESVNISGGEPFLREDLPEIIRIISKQSPKAKIIISTNGLSPSLIKKQMQKIISFRRDIGVAVSVDGIGKNHDKIRGFIGAYGLSLETIRILTELGVKDLKLAFTLSDKNINQLKRVYRLSQELSVEFSLAVVHNSSYYFQKSNNYIKYISYAKSELEWLIKQELKSFSPKRWLRAYFTYGLVKLIEEKIRILPDYSGIRSLFIDPFGNIYPSNIWNFKISHLSKVNSWQKIILKHQDQVFKKNPVNWMICTARESIKENRFKVFSWIFKNKIEISLASFLSWFKYEKDEKACQKN